ncbi:hypothetical protein ACHAWF_013818 [Thalassiosira exigua]
MLLDIFRTSRPKETSQIKENSPKTEAHKAMGEEADRKAFLAYARQSGLATTTEWPTNSSPVLVVPSHRAKDVEYRFSCHEDRGKSSLAVLPMDGCVLSFDGPHFEGKLVSRMRDTSSTIESNGSIKSSMPNGEYFQNRSRQYQWSVQGRFKKRTRFDKIVTGQEFGRPFRNAPSSRVVKKALDLLKHKLPETFECDLFSDEPRFEHPLLAGCQHFRVDRPDDIKELDGNIHGVGTDGNVIEDTSLLADDSVPQDGVARRKYFAKNCNLEKYFFEPDLTYTFDFFANFFSPARHRLELTPFFSVDLIPYFNGFPLFMSMAKEKDSQEYLWATEMWHRRLLNYDESPGRLARLFTGSGEKEGAGVDETVCETVVEDD